MVWIFHLGIHALLTIFWINMSLNSKTNFAFKLLFAKNLSDLQIINAIYAIDIKIWENIRNKINYSIQICIYIYLKY